MMRVKDLKMVMVVNNSTGITYKTIDGEILEDTFENYLQNIRERIVYLVEAVGINEYVITVY